MGLHRSALWGVRGTHICLQLACAVEAAADGAGILARFHRSGGCHMESKTPMSKKNIVGRSVVVVPAPMGERPGTWVNPARRHYEEALEEARGFPRPQAVVSHQYERGFWTSHARLVLQWSAPTSADASDAPSSLPDPHCGGQHPAPRPAGGARLAAAVVESRFAAEGLMKRPPGAGKVSPPTLTTVHRLLGGHDRTLPCPPVRWARATSGWFAGVDLSDERGCGPPQGERKFPVARAEPERGANRQRRRRR